MTRPPRQKAFTLMEIIALLPVILVLMLAAYGVANRVEGMQSQEASRRQDDARIRDLVRRIQDDAGRASQASVEDAPEGRQLNLHLPGGIVTYTAAPAGIVRSEQPAGGPAVRYAWSLEHTKLDFQIETVGPKSHLVWILFATKLTFDRGPGYERHLSAAAVVGRGGVR